MKKILVILFFSINAHAQVPAVNFYQLNGVNCLSDPSYDNDAANFICTAGITDATQKSAIDRLVKDLKGYANGSYATTNIWSKFIAIYPMVGGTATTHKYNLRNPSKYTITFSGTGWTHSSTGAKPGGVTGTYADTGIPGTALTTNSTHLSYYSGTQVTEQRYEMAINSASSGQFALLCNWNTIGVICDMYNQTSGQGRVQNSRGSGSTGFFVGSRTANNDLRIYYAGSQIGSTSTGTTIDAIPTGSNFGIGGFGILSNSYVSTKECRFASIGSGLTPTEVANLYNAVQAFETTLSRNL